MEPILFYTDPNSGKDMCLINGELSEYSGTRQQEQAYRLLTSEKFRHEYKNDSSMSEARFIYRWILGDIVLHYHFEEKDSNGKFIPFTFYLDAPDSKKGNIIDRLPKALEQVGMTVSKENLDLLRDDYNKFVRMKVTRLVLLSVIVALLGVIYALITVLN